jgi:hypothetical protein
MLLHDKPSLAPGLSGNRLSTGLGGPFEIALLPIRAERHPNDDPGLKP